MKTLIVCKHNWTFVKLKSVHAQIDSAFYHVSRAHYQFLTDSLNAYY